MSTTTIVRMNGYNTAPEEKINLNWPERYISVAAGVKLGFSGLRNLFKSPFSSLLKLGAGGYLMNRGITGHCELYSQMGKDSMAPVNINIKSSFTVNKPRMAVYNFWRKLDNLPLFMNHLESVDVLDSERSHWVLKLPTGVANVSWDAEIVMDAPGEFIGWSSLPGSIIDTAGKIRFRDTENGGTLIDVLITYQPPAGGIGAGLAHVLNPLFKNMVDTDVQNFRQYMDMTDLEEVVIIV
ncbi:SRPBCC family protein [Mucilaginibacter sp.]|uniref:SRPBCC family protein n=1 Tax=Mucilaginibacter sp. TaxID=1882438 RepID=UPI00283AE3D5|nr:SRPBCC family protein [Mucilaginibacter sp.]MDR3695004.1 SRPBCC family protein [Mucilaginibacter sp.]